MEAGSGSQHSLFPTPRGLEWERVFVAIPAVAVLGLAALYAVGALLKAAQLQGAGLSISDTLPLFSLEEILGAGIGTVIRSAVLLALFLVLMLVIPWVMRRVYRGIDEAHAREDRKKKQLRQRVEAWEQDPDPVEKRRLLRELQEDEKQERQQVRLYLASMTTASLLVIVLLLFATPVLSITLLLSFVGVKLVTRLPRERRRRLSIIYILSQFLVFLTALVISAFVYPTPLPVASIELKHGGSISGGLISIDDSAWFVAKGSWVESVPVQQMKTGSFHSSTPERPATTGERVLDFAGID